MVSGIHNEVSITVSNKQNIKFVLYLQITDKVKGCKVLYTYIKYLASRRGCGSFGRALAEYERDAGIDAQHHHHR